MTPSRAFASSFLPFVVVVVLAISFVAALVAPMLLLLHVEAFPLYALSGGAYMFAMVIGGENVLRVEHGAATSRDPRRAVLALRVVSGISFVMTALHAWSDAFPWLQGPALAATEVVLSLSIIASVGDLLLHTLRRTRRSAIAARVR